MTSPIAYAPVVAAPQAARGRYGLFNAAIGPLDMPAHGAAAGVRFVPETCGSSIAYGIACYTAEDPAPDKPLYGDSEEVVTGAFAVVSTFNCGAVGYTRAQQIEKARRALELTEQATVERALWTGTDFEGNALGILSLDAEASEIPTNYDPVLITDVLGALERFAYVDNQYGGQAYIHAPIEVAAFAAEAGLILADGNRKVTPLGSIWAFGTYPSGQVIVTGQTAVWRDPQIAIADAFDRTTNERLILAERAYAVSFECFAGSAEFDPLEAVSS